MSPHKGLLHDLKHAAAATATQSSPSSSYTASPHVAEIASNTTIAQNGTESTNTTASSSSENSEGHAAVYYISRAFPFICLAIVLLLASCRAIVAIRHWRRIRRRRARTKDGHVPLLSEDPDETTSSDHSALSVGSADGTFDGSESTLVESLVAKPGRESHVGMEAGITGRRDLAGREPRNGRTSRYWSAWEATYRNWMYLRTVPSWIYRPDTMADALWTVGYSTLLIGFAVASIPGMSLIPLIFPSSLLTTVENEFWALYLANALGVLAFCQCPLIIILIQKNNPISSLTGITYQKLNYLHRASSRVALFFSYAHIALWTPRVWHAGHFTHWYIIWVS